MLHYLHHKFFINIKYLKLPSLFGPAEVPSCENCTRRNFHKAEFPRCEISDDEISGGKITEQSMGTTYTRYICTLQTLYTYRNASKA